MTPQAIRTLNEECFCVPVRKPDLDRLLREETALDPVALKASHPHLFAETAVFVAHEHLDRMQAAVSAIEALAASPAWRNRVLARAPSLARHPDATAGLFMGYDFHLGPEGPRLIEINTNAGGAFLNAVLAEARSNCCSEDAGRKRKGGTLAVFSAAVADAIRSEWNRAGRPGSPRTIAIVDDDPAGQYLHPEFLAARIMLAHEGFEVLVADPSELVRADGRLVFRGQGVDLVYNRLTDFYLDEPAHAVLRDSWLAGETVLSPNPVHHALYANKANLVDLANPAFAVTCGLPDGMARALDVVPPTIPVTETSHDSLWEARKTLFFKPLSGHAGKAVYRGDKITRTVWQQVLAGDYIAQTIVPPGERAVRVDGIEHRHKMDVRLYTYAGKTLMVAARLYQGQTTNFRTPGGGFAPVIVA